MYCWLTMSKNHIRFRGVLAAFAASAAAVVAQAQLSVVYDNTEYLDPPRYIGFLGQKEFGDEVTLSGLGSHDYLGVTYFELSYTTPAGFEPGPGKVGYLHFYDLTGPGKTPGAELMAPVAFQLGAPPGEIQTFVWETWDPVVVPRTFVWSVSFSGVEGQDVGLDLADPPVVGSSFKDFWVKEEGGWTLRLIDNGNVPANFYARILAIPEPTTLQLLAVAGAVGLWFLRRRS